MNLSALPDHRADQNPPWSLTFRRRSSRTHRRRASPSTVQPPQAWNCTPVTSSAWTKTATSCSSTAPRTFDKPVLRRPLIAPAQSV